MSKRINITYSGVTYTLEFTRKSIELMERRGFKISEIQDKPMTTFPALFEGSFLANHKFVKKEIIDKIFNQLGDKGNLLEKLAEMYNEPIEAMMDEPEDSEGNLEWGANW